MAMEIKTLDVKNEEESETIEFWAQFGWSLKSSQRVYNKDSHLESRGDSTYSVTETVDFTKLVFERDKNGPNYPRIVELEREYFAIAASLPAQKPTVRESYPDAKAWATATKPDLRKKSAKTINLVAIIGGFGLTLALEMFNYTITMVLQGIGLVIGIGALIAKAIIKKKALRKGLEDATSEEAATMNEGYKEYLQKQGKEATALTEYNNKLDRGAAILEELDTLI